MRLPRAALVLVLSALTLPATLASMPAWEALPEMPGARAEVATVVVDDAIYVIGGVFADFLPGVSATEGRVDVYDITTQTWRAAPSLPLSLNHVAAVAIGPRIYAIGGYYGSTLFEPVSLTWVLDTSLPAAEQAWEPWVPLPAPRGAHAAATDGRTLWVFGGIGAPGPVSLGVPEAPHERTVLRIDTAADVPVWEPIGLFPDVRDHLAGVYADGKVYAIGGRDLLPWLYTGRVDVLDVASNTWTQAASMPTPRGGFGAALVGSRIVAIGGEDRATVFDDVEALNITTGGWETLPPLPAGRHGVGVVAHEGAVYVEAGGPAAGYAFSALNTRLHVG